MVPSWADQLLLKLLMEQYDTLPIQCRHIEHTHEGVWFRKNNFWQNDSSENLDNFSLIRCLYMHRWCLHGPINSYHNFWWSNLILCLYNVDTLNICTKEFGGVCICIDGAFMGWSTPTTAFDGAFCYFAYTMICTKEFGSEKIIFDKMTAVRT